MDTIEKLFAKISSKDRARLLMLIEQLIADTLPTNVQIVKIKSSDLYRIRSGRFRVIFYRDAASKENIIVNVTQREKDTYKGA